MSHQDYTIDKLSQRLPSLLPEYLKDESPMFEAFLNAYFEYLEAEILVLDVESDIDGILNEDGTGALPVDFLFTDLGNGDYKLKTKEEFVNEYVRQARAGKLTDGNSQVMLALKSGKAIRFEEAKTRPMGRNASGVRGIRLQHDKDEVIGMVAVNDMESNILVVSSNGYGKRSRLDDYRITNRGGKGVKTISITEKTGDLVAIKNVDDTNGLMIINKSGIAIRMAVKNLRVMGRATQGVKLINLKANDSIAAVAKVVHEEDEDQDQNIEIIDENNSNIE